MYFLKEQNIAGKTTFLIKEGWGSKIKGILYFPYQNADSIKEKVFKNINYIIETTFKEKKFNMGVLKKEIKLSYGYLVGIDNVINLKFSFDLGNIYQFVKEDLLIKYNDIIVSKFTEDGLKNTLDKAYQDLTRYNFNQANKEKINLFLENLSKKTNYIELLKEILFVAFDDEIKQANNKIIRWKNKKK